MANGRHVTADNDGVLVNDQLRPNGWVVRETFRLLAGADGDVALLHIASGRYVVVDADGALGAWAESLEAATTFLVQPLGSGRGDAVRAAREADVAVVVVGNHPLINGRETEDRVDLELPPAQEALLRAVHAANPRTVVVVQSSYPYAISWAQDHVPAILWSSHGGQEFGHALADVLFGVVAPAGRLTQTWYASAADRRPARLRHHRGRRDVPVLPRHAALPVGHGLTYTTFGYSDLQCGPSSWTHRRRRSTSASGHQHGERGQRRGVQLYTRQQIPVKQPLRQLRGLPRVHLTPASRRPCVPAGGGPAPLGRHPRSSDRGDSGSRHGRPVLPGLQVATTDHRTGRGGAAPGRARRADLRRRARRLPGSSCATPPRRGTPSAPPRPGPGSRSPGGLRRRATVCTARVSGLEERPAVVTLRLDDPLQGEVIGTVEARPRGGRYGWVDAVARLGPATGVHDLYAVFGAAGVALDTLTFTTG